ncbi:MAG: hypothetical protein MR630_09545, partial [Selenomonas sp.]|uniref:hypothetical protein n=1 Tax=Selenomonas sp. TaxID=2053611 RepID=UPI0025EF1C74
MANRRIDDVTIYENTKLKCALYTNPYSPVTLKGEGASISVFENEYKATLAAGSAEATLSFDDMHANCWDLTGTDGTKLSGEVGNYMLYGMVDISDVSKSTYTAHVGPNATVKTAQGTIHGASEYKWNNFLVDGDTTTIWNGTFGDIEKTGNGKLVVRNENEAWDLTAGNITADEVITAGNVTANSIMADEVSGKNVSVTDTLSVAKELNVDTVTASTVILASGASVSGQKGGTSNIKTNMLQVDPATAATALANATVAAKTEGGTVNITNLAGLKIPDATLAKIATAAKLSEGGYTSATTGDTKKNVTEMLDKADQLGKGTTTTKLQDGTDAVAYEHTYTSTTNAGTATVTTTGTVTSDGTTPVLNVDTQNYTFDLSKDAKDKDTFLTSTNPGTTTIHGAEVKVKADNSQLLSLNKGESVTLLNDEAGTLAYDGTSTFDHKYTNSAGTATVRTTGTVQAVDNDLILRIDGADYAFTLNSATTADGYTFLTSANTGETKIDAEDVTLDDSKLANQMLSLNKDDKVYLLKNDTAGTLAYTDASGAKELNHTYENSTDAGTATVTTHAKVEASGNDLVLNVDSVKYAFTLAPTVKNEDTLLELSNAGETKISNGDVTVKTSGVLKKLKQGEKVYLLKKTNGTLTATDVTYLVNLPTIYGTIRGNVAEDASNNALVLNVMGAESLTDNLGDYKYIVIVEGDTKNTGNEVTVGAGEIADRSAIAALAKDETNATELTDNTLTVNGTVTGRAVGANSYAGDVTKNNVTIGAGALVDGFVAGGMTQDGTANGNTVTINGGTIKGDVYGGYSEKEATNNIVNLAGGTIFGTVYGGYVADTSGTSSNNTLNVTGATTAGNIAKFDTYNFELPAETKANDVLLHLTSNADTNMQGSTVNVHADGSTSLKDAETVYLIKKDGGNLLTDTAIKQNVDVLVGVTAKLNGTVTNENNNLVLTTKAVPVSNSGGGGYFPPSPPSTTSTTEKTEETSSSGSSGGSGSSESSGSTTKTTSSNAVTVAADKTVKNAFGAYSAKRNARVKMARNTLTVTGDVEGTAAGASTASGDVAQNTVTVAEGATISENVYGARTEDGAA